MQSLDDEAVCRGLVDTGTGEDTGGCGADYSANTCLNKVIRNHPQPPSRLLASTSSRISSSVSSSSSLSSVAAALATGAPQQQYANVAEIMSTSKKYDSNQVCF